MSETVVTTSAPTVAPIDPAASKSIIITKSISSLTSNQTAATDASKNVTPITLNKDQVETALQNENQPSKVLVSDDKTEIKLNATAKLDENQKLENRVKKFGVQSDNVKKNLRAQRFGVDTTAAQNSASPENKEKLATRAQRFGITEKEPENGTQTKEALEKRAQRFGTAASASPSVTNEAAEKRKQRFGIVDDESKKKLRGERFQTQK